MALRELLPKLLDPAKLKILKQSGHVHWKVFQLNPFSEALNSQSPLQSASLEKKTPTLTSDHYTSTSTSTSGSRSSGSERSMERSSRATSESGSSDQPDEAGSGKRINPSGSSTTIAIVPSSNLTGFVLFGVLGSKRLQNARLRLAQIDVALFKDDDSFFDEMNVQYKKLRGFLRRTFSVWVFHTCNFIMVVSTGMSSQIPGKG